MGVCFYKHALCLLEDKMKNKKYLLVLAFLIFSVTISCRSTEEEDLKCEGVFSSIEYIPKQSFLGNSLTVFYFEDGTKYATPNLFPLDIQKGDSLRLYRGSFGTWTAVWSTPKKQ